MSLQHKGSLKPGQNAIVFSWLLSKALNSVVPERANESKTICLAILQTPHLFWPLFAYTHIFGL